MNQLINSLIGLWMLSGMASPGTGDEFRPWIAAIILIVSIIVLVALFLVRKRNDSGEDSYQDEDEQS